jgi:hypothetical protein
MQRGSKNVKTDAEFHAGRCYRFCLARKIFSACESAANVSGQSQFIRMRSARPRLVRRSRGLQFVGLAMKFCGKLHELAARRIVPRQPSGQPQAGLGFIPEICRVHRCIPACSGASVAAQSRPRRGWRRDGDHRLSVPRHHKRGSAAIIALKLDRRSLASPELAPLPLAKPLRFQEPSLVCGSGI